MVIQSFLSRQVVEIKKAADYGENNIVTHNHKLGICPDHIPNPFNKGEFTITKFSDQDIFDAKHILNNLIYELDSEPIIHSEARRFVISFCKLRLSRLPVPKGEKFILDIIIKYANNLNMGDKVINMLKDEMNKYGVKL